MVHPTPSTFNPGATRDKFVWEVVTLSRDVSLQPLPPTWQHKGYGTAKHMAAIRQHGPSPIHRRTFIWALQRLTSGPHSAYSSFWTPTAPRKVLCY